MNYHYSSVKRNVFPGLNLVKYGEIVLKKMGSTELMGKIKKPILFTILTQKSNKNVKYSIIRVILIVTESGSDRRETESQLLEKKLAKEVCTDGSSKENWI